MTTREYCLSLLDQVDEAGRNPDLAYLVRTRLRRAVIGLERGRRSESGSPPLQQAPQEIRELTTDLTARVIWLCQPSEALDVRWKREWTDVLEGVKRLRHWLDAA